MSAAAPQLRAVESEHSGSVIGAKPPLVTPGIYTLLYEFDETRILSKRATKLVLWFRIVTQGEFYGIRLPRWYNVAKIEGKPRRHGGFKVGWKSDFMRDYAAVFNSIPNRTNRIPMIKFEGVEIRGRVKTVVSGWQQKNIPQLLHYSVIELLLSAPTPSPTPAPCPTPTLKHPREGE